MSGIGSIRRTACIPVGTVRDNAGPAFHDGGEAYMSIICERAAIPKIGWEWHSALSIGALATATPCARLHARNVVYEWGLHDIADAVELVVSELVTNSVKSSMDDGRPRYSAESGLAYVHLRLSSDRVVMLVEVWDENAGLPVPTRPSLDDDSGRGLMLVAALSQQWGWDLSQNGIGKIVWSLIAPLAAAYR
jgi:anti-sigma regulatory factor (Ser/Thr protein kinase)